MPALPPAVASLERRLGVDEGSLDGVDLARAEEALLDATALALAEVSPARATTWTASAPAVVATVILKAARREYENPQGFRQQGVGEVSASVDVASGVYLTASEVAQIKRAAGAGSGFVGTVRTPSAYESPSLPLL